jgi:threonine dehydrogenase-like Zn-dependent dehydrogenase
MDLFDEIFNSSEQISNPIQDATEGRGCSVTIDCSGSTPGRLIAIENVAEWGRVALVGEGGTLETEVSDSLLHKQVTIYASWVTSLQNMEELIHLFAAWKMHPDKIVSHVLPLSQADEAYRLVSSGEAVKVCLVPGAGQR